jgi:putative methionine-R-sulfoxide reductase with GAF domain
MDSYSILDNRPSQAEPKTAPPTLVPPQPPMKSVPAVRETLRFPGEDGGKSLSEMAQRDLDATLQLLAERAQYITGASGAAIALREGETMVCCASAGSSAPELGVHLQIDSGLSAESVRTRQILRCDDAENDPRVNRESCKAFGIASVVVMPLVHGEEVYGVFELLSGRPHAFEERDFVALKRLADMIGTAVELSDGARRAEKEFGQPGIETAVAAEPESAKTGSAKLASSKTGPPEFPVASQSDMARADSEPRAPVIEKALAAAAAAGTSETPAVPGFVASPTPVGTLGLVANPDEIPATTDLSAPISTIAFGNLRRCESCGFPVSEGRKLCLDCEAANPGAVASVESAPEWFGQLDEANPSWIRSHAYLVATALLAVATIALLFWRF